MKKEIFIKTYEQFSEFGISFLKDKSKDCDKDYDELVKLLGGKELDEQESIQLSLDILNKYKLDEMLKKKNTNSIDTPSLNRRAILQYMVFCLYDYFLSDASASKTENVE